MLLGANAKIKNNHEWVFKNVKNIIKTMTFWWKDNMGKKICRNRNGKLFHFRGMREVEIKVKVEKNIHVWIFECIEKQCHGGVKQVVCW